MEVLIGIETLGGDDVGCEGVGSAGGVIKGGDCEKSGSSKLEK